MCCMTCAGMRHASDDGAVVRACRPVGSGLTQNARFCHSNAPSFLCIMLLFMVVVKCRLLMVVIKCLLSQPPSFVLPL